MQLSGDENKEIQVQGFHFWFSPPTRPTPTSETTEARLLVVFTDVRLVVPPDRGSQVFGRSNRSFSDAQRRHIQSSDSITDHKLGKAVIFSPDHAGGGVAHGGVFGLDELLVVVDAAVDFVVLFAQQLLLREK